MWKLAAGVDILLRRYTGRICARSQINDRRQTRCTRGNGNQAEGTGRVGGEERDAVPRWGTAAISRSWHFNKCSFDPVTHVAVTKRR